MSTAKRPARTQVCIAGAGPAGLVLAHLLEREGIETVVLEAKDRAYVESRVRAGVLEHGSVELLDELGLSGRLHREGQVHGGVNLQFEGERHRIDFVALTGKTITVYGQQEVVKDLIAARLGSGGPILFECAVREVRGSSSDAPVVCYEEPGSGLAEVACDWVAGCDGFHGACRASLPPGSVEVYEHEHPFAWLGILAAVAPSSEELVYSFHPRGFALHSLRSPSVSRLYIQVDPSEDLAAWPDERVWQELQVRLACPGWSLAEGPVLEKGITPMRSFVAEPMRHGRLLLAGDAAHIVPPTGAKGMNLAIADVAALAEALADWYRSGRETGLDDYSRRCLARVWRVQDFSMWMTSLMHVYPSGDGFSRRLQRARQEYLVRSDAQQRSLAENYVGLPFRWGC